MHLLLTDPGNESLLLKELDRTVRAGQHRVLAPRLVTTDLTLQSELPPILVFARQCLPDIQPAQGNSINAWAQRILSALAALPDEKPWRLHLLPHYGSGHAGENRCRLIRERLLELLQQKRRHFRKRLNTTSSLFNSEDSFVQVLLTGPDTGFISIAPAPEPFALRRLISPFPAGEIAVASDKAAPSRAFAKLVEAEQRLGERIGPGQTCVDLGASPGSWSYLALNRGARVVAVDRAPLRRDLIAHPNLRFHKADAFAFVPAVPVDWLLCDVIAAPERSIELLLRWARENRMTRFVVTIKFKGTEDYGILEPLKYSLPPRCDDFFLTRLCANKNEVCAFGRLA